MRNLMLLLLGCCFAGCTTTTRYVGPAMPEQIETAKQRMKLLRAGMTEKQVFDKLGLSDCYERCFNVAGGSPQNPYISYFLSDGHGLTIQHDGIDSTKNTVASVSLDDVRWSRQEKK